MGRILYALSKDSFSFCLKELNVGAVFMLLSSEFQNLGPLKLIVVLANKVLVRGR